MNESPRVLGNRYEVGDLLGRGGMAEVHAGRDLRLGRSVAIKLLRTDLARDTTFQARFRREAQSAAALNHPAIVAVYDTGEEQIVETGGALVSLPYIVMEQVEGRTLRELLGDGHPLDVESALRITSGVLTALEYSHRIGIVHRDIKPANVMLTPQGEIKVMDFGIARALADASSTMTQTQAVIGTAQYLSPEQARGESVDIRSDLYSTGCLLYELLTGRPPFVADSPVAVAYQHVREYAAPPSTYNPAIPEDVDRIVLHSLGKDRTERYQDAAEFRADIEAARAGRQVAAAPVGRTLDEAAATQVFGGATRAMSPVGGGLLAENGTAGGSPFDSYDQGGYDEPAKSRRGAVAGLVLLIVLVLVGVAFAVSKLVGGGGGDAVAQVAVPAIQGKDQAALTTAFTTAGLVLSPQTEASDSIAEGLAIRSDPAAGTSADKGSTVTVWFSAGSSTVAVPELEGKSRADAEAAIVAAGLTVGEVTPDESDEDAGTVLSSNPGAGTEVAKGQKVNLSVSNGKVGVPNVVGSSYSSAKKTLEAAGFQVEQVPLTTLDAKAGDVLIQDPQGNTTAEGGSTITLTVAIAPSPSATPTETPTDDPTDGNDDPTETPTTTVPN